MANSAEDQISFLSTMLASVEDRFLVEAVGNFEDGGGLEEHPVFIRVDNSPEAEFDNRHVYEDLSRQMEGNGSPEVSPYFMADSLEFWEGVFFRSGSTDNTAEKDAAAAWQIILEASFLAYGGGRIPCINCATSGSVFNPGSCSSCGWTPPLPSA